MLPRTVLPPKSTLVTELIASTPKANGPPYFATKTPLTDYPNNAIFNLRGRANAPGPGGFSNKDVGIFLGSIIGFIVLVLLLVCCFRRAGRGYTGYFSSDGSSDDSASSRSAVPIRKARSRQARADLPSSLEGNLGVVHGAPQASHDDDPIVEIVDESRPKARKKRTKSQAFPDDVPMVEIVEGRPKAGYKRTKPKGTEGTHPEASMEEVRARRVPTTYAYSAATQSGKGVQIPTQQRERYATGRSVLAMFKGKPVAAKRPRKVRGPKGGKNIVSPPITEAGDSPPPPSPPPPAPGAA